MKPPKLVCVYNLFVKDICIIQEKAILIYEDNQGVLLMANSGQPTNYTQYIVTGFQVHV